MLYFVTWGYLKLVAWRVLVGAVDATAQECWATVFLNVVFIHLAFRMFFVIPRPAFSDVRCCRVLKCFSLTVLCALHWFSRLERLRLFFFFSLLWGVKSVQSSPSNSSSSSDSSSDSDFEPSQNHSQGVLQEMKFVKNLPCITLKGSREWDLISQQHI